MAEDSAYSTTLNGTVGMRAATVEVFIYWFKGLWSSQGYIALILLYY
jgi:hypothetical protein